MLNDCDFYYVWKSGGVYIKYALTLAMERHIRAISKFSEVLKKKDDELPFTYWIRYGGRV